jgi:hypothetical protein
VCKLARCSPESEGTAEIFELDMRQEIPIRVMTMSQKVQADVQEKETYVNGGHHMYKGQWSKDDDDGTRKKTSVSKFWAAKKGAHVELPTAPITMCLNSSCRM